MSKSTGKKPSRLSALKNVPKRAVKFLSGMWTEVKKITWLSKKELIQHTGVVLGLVVIMALIFWIADSGLRAATLPLFK